MPERLILGTRISNWQGPRKVVATTGSIVFVDEDGILTEDNTRLYFDEENIRLAVGTNTPEAALDVDVIDSGVLVPRVTETERDAISSPPESLLVYNTDTGSFNYYDGSDWRDLAGTLNARATLNNIITPAAIGADTNDYAPTGIAEANFLRLSSSATYNITGLLAPASPVDTQVLVIRNVGANNIVLKDQDAGSVAANRFDITADKTLAANDTVTIAYDTTSARWFILN